jgi:alpha-tubulin suppressor-like RCC1 family protein
MFLISVTHPTHPDFTVPGIVLALGEGDVGQLGLGEDIIERARPAHVKIEDKMVQVCAGGMHTVCLTNQGKVSYGLVVFYLGLKRGMVFFFKKGTLHVEFTKKGT